MKPEGMRNLALHEYKSGAYTPLDNLMNPWWLWIASFVPASISPNMVTVSGFLLEIAATVIAFFHYNYNYSHRHSGGADFCGISKFWMQIFLAFFQFTYQTLDA